MLMRLAGRRSDGWHNDYRLSGWRDVGLRVGFAPLGLKTRRIRAFFFLVVFFQ